jgi:hypothetical protein
VSHADSDQLVSHPRHAVDVTDALVACMERSGTSAGVDVPDVQEAIVCCAQAGQEARIGAEGYAVDPEGMVRKRRERRVRGRIWCGREDEDARFVSGLA